MDEAMPDSHSALSFDERTAFDNFKGLKGMIEYAKDIWLMDGEQSCFDDC